MSENLTITYTNYRGETSVRRITPMALYYGRSEWHEGWQWILRARDLDKDEVREFALKDFGAPATARNDALEEAAKVAAEAARKANETAEKHPPGSDSRDRMQARAREAKYIESEIRAIKSETKP